MSKRLVILGSTGSIGTQALDVARLRGYTVTALAAHSNAALLEEQIREFKPRAAALFDEAAARDLRVRVADLSVEILSGMDGLCALAQRDDADVVLNSVVGMVGLQPTLAALKAGHDVALANKETLVAGGELVMRTAREHGVRILPVDSEHSAIFQCLQATAHGAWAPPQSVADMGVSRLILTASGGPFFGRSREELRTVTLADALKHPNWSMGQKITIDSATMMNKGLELIEAKWLFDLPQENIDIVVHRESVIHSLVEYNDNSVLAQLGVPDMRIPIQYALTWPERVPSPVPKLDLAAFAKLTFYEPDGEAFPMIDYCRRALAQGGAYPAAVNAANEEANAAFRAGKIGFLQIGEAVAQVLEQPLPKVTCVEDILAVDEVCRRRVREAAEP
ncbi:MAG: 1-deoxy-D-xylulose-5-phosphate reductoisomerase [Clostridia bacterium]|nr:1-deoxy-D-xylulose-5-phosphate reductoisomerase [Clostridia bacterium]